jgi:hypothetical protein
VAEGLGQPNVLFAGTRKLEECEKCSCSYGILFRTRGQAVVTSSTVQECRAKALEFDERARTARLPEIKRHYEELARQRRSMAETWEWVITEQYRARCIKPT